MCSLSTEMKIPRRALLSYIGLLLPASMLAEAPEAVRRLGWGAAAEAATPDLITDTLNGLIAFVVPGPDPYSVAQGVSTQEPGGIDADIVQGLAAGLDAALPLPSISTTVSTLLNG